MTIRNKAKNNKERGYWGSDAVLELADVLAFGFRALPRRVKPWLSVLALKKRRVSQLHEKLRQQIYKKSLPMHPLLDCVTKMPQVRNCPAFEFDNQQRVLVGSVIGFDVLPCSDGFTVVEANIGVGQQFQRYLHNDTNPFIENIFEFGNKQGFENIEIINNDRGLPIRQEEQYREVASNYNMTVRIIEPASTNWHGRYRSSFMPAHVTRNTLRVRIRNFPSWPDFLMGNKSSVQTSLQNFFLSNTIKNVRVPDTTADWMSRIDWDSGRFPNVVAKMSDADGGVGVLFLKARSAENVRRLLVANSKQSSGRIGGILGAVSRSSISKEVLLQPFERSRFFDGDRLAIFRINVLITPLGNKMLSATKYLGDEPVPETLPFGRVLDPMPFLVNGGVRASRHIPTDAEHEELEPVAEALGKAMAHLLKQHFVTSISGNDRPLA